MRWGNVIGFVVFAGCCVFLEIWSSKGAGGLWIILCLWVICGSFDRDDDCDCELSISTDDPDEANKANQEKQQGENA